MRKRLRIILPVCAVVLVLGISAIAYAYKSSDTPAASQQAAGGKSSSKAQQATAKKSADTKQSKGAKVTPTPPPVAPPTTAVLAANTGYTVRGNRVLDSSGKAHLFHGLNRPSLEWASQGDRLSLADYTLMSSWKANVIRLPLNQKFWIQNTDNYQATVAQQVTWINSLGMDVILDLHWSVGGDMANKADQYNMADEFSRVFWKDVASKYKDNPKVLFELYNEPREISWEIWRNGGETHDVKTEPNTTFNAAGMQQLYDDVRSTGAKNLVIIGGIDWAYDLSEVPTRKITGNNIIYATHPYDNYGKNTKADWDRGFGNLSASQPVMITEFGTFNCSTDLYSGVLDYARERSISWTGWAWFAGDCKFPALITDWAGTPSAAGAVVKAAM